MEALERSLGQATAAGNDTQTLLDSVNLLLRLYERRLFTFRRDASPAADLPRLVADVARLQAAMVALGGIAATEIARARAEITEHLDAGPPAAAHDARRADQRHRCAQVLQSFSAAELTLQQVVGRAEQDARTLGTLALRSAGAPAAAGTASGPTSIRATPGSTWH